MNNGFVRISSGAGKEEKMGNNENMLPQEKEKKGTKSDLELFVSVFGQMLWGFVIQKVLNWQSELYCWDSL